MIQKLLDEPYWTELDSHVKRHFGKKDVIRCCKDANGKISLNSLIGEMCRNRTQEESPSPQNSINKNVFNRRQVGEALSDLSVTKDAILHEIFWYVLVKESYASLEKEMKLVSNLEVLFQMLLYKMTFPIFDPSFKGSDLDYSLKIVKLLDQKFRELLRGGPA